MKWEKKICIRITPQRLLGAVLIAASTVNLIIVAAAADVASSFSLIPVTGPTLTSSPATGTLVISTATTWTMEAIAPSSTDPPPQTPSATFTSTFTPTNTVTPTSSASPSPSPTQCLPFTWWLVYIVGPDDTLYSLAPQVNSSVPELMFANCLPDSRIYIGQRLYVPRLPPTATPTHTITPASPPDLVITGFQATGAAQINVRQQTISIPVQVVVQNQGGARADIFKLSVQYLGGIGIVRPALTLGQTDLWSAFITTPLPAGQQATFAGVVYLPYAWHGQAVPLGALADSCGGEAGMPPTCRVLESNEANNGSYPIQVNLPSDSPPSVVITNPDADVSYFFDVYDQTLQLWYRDISLSAYVTDPEDGILDGNALVWTTDRTDISMYKVNPILGRGASLQTRLYLNDCNGHTITLTVTDSTGNVVTATRRIYASCIN